MKVYVFSLIRIIFAIFIHSSHINAAWVLTSFCLTESVTMPAWRVSIPLMIPLRMMKLIYSGSFYNPYYDDAIAVAVRKGQNQLAA